MRLCESVSDRCLVTGDVVHHRPGLLRQEEMSRDFRTSATVLRLEHINSVSDLMDAAQKMEGRRL